MRDTQQRGPGPRVASRTVGIALILVALANPLVMSGQAATEKIEITAPPWENPLGDPLVCGGREFFKTQGSAGAPGSNFHVQIWEERQSALDYANDELIYALVTYNKQFASWRGGVTMLLESRSIASPYFPWPIVETLDFHSNDDARDGCSGILFQTTAKRSRPGTVGVEYHFCALSKTETASAGTSWTVSASVTHTLTWEVSGSTTPPSVSGSVGGEHGFTVGGSYTNAEENSYSTTPVDQVGEVSFTMGGR